MSSSIPNKNVTKTIDCIFDKGLLDALLCSEGWNGLVERLFGEVSALLATGGSYILVSYQLPSSTKEFLSKLGMRWEFGLFANKYGRVELSRAIQKTPR